MAIRRILLFPDSRLNKISHAADASSSQTKTIIQDLLDTMYAGPGVGLAAPQIGVLKQISVIDTGRKKKPGKKLIVLINPTLLRGKGRQIPREGCLSVPDLLANVSRYNWVEVETETRDGGKKIIQAEGFDALALQHEIDHLNGKLFLDRVENIRTDVFRRKTY